MREFLQDLTGDSFKRGLGTSLAVGFLCFALAGLMSACNQQPPTVIEITNTNTNTQGGTPSPAPSSSPDATGDVATVGIGKFGEACPAGTAPSGIGDAVKVGCTAFITCSPRDAEGREIFNLQIIGPEPTEFRAVEGEGTTVRSQVPSNPYNRDVLGIATGAARYLCTVKGKTSPSFTLRVVG